VTSHPRIRAVAVGYASLDHAMQIGEFHGAQATTLVRRRLSDPWPGFGGVAHIARALRASGLDTETVSWVGDGTDGSAWIENLRASGVGSAGVAVRGAVTPAAYLLYPPGGDTICIYDPGDCHLDELTDAQRQLVEQADWCCLGVAPAPITADVLQVIPPTTRVAWAVKNDPDAFPPSLVRALLARADVVSFSAAEIGFLTDAVGTNRLAEVCRPGCLLTETRGAQGVRFQIDGREVAVPATPVPEADTTGAGDTFIAGLIGALAARPDDPSAAVTAAVAAVTRLLAQRAARHRGAAIHPLA
jgi:ribokinase